MFKLFYACSIYTNNTYAYCMNPGQQISLIIKKFAEPLCDNLNESSRAEFAKEYGKANVEYGKAVIEGANQPRRAHVIAKQKYNLILNFRNNFLNIVSFR